MECKKIFITFVTMLFKDHIQKQITFFKITFKD